MCGSALSSRFGIHQALSPSSAMHGRHQGHPDQERVDEHPDRETEGDRLDRRVAVGTKAAKTEIMISARR